MTLTIPYTSEGNASLVATDAQWSAMGSIWKQASQVTHLLHPVLRWARGSAPPTSYERSLQLVESGQILKAIQLLQSELKQTKVQPQSEQLLADLLLANENFDQAICHYRSLLEHAAPSLELTTKLREALLAYSGHLADQQHLEAAIAYLRQAIDLPQGDGSSAAGVYCQLGQLLQQQKQWPSAATAYETAIQLLPGKAEIHQSLGQVLVKQGKLESAISAYQRALKLKPNFSALHHDLGWALYLQGHLHEAIRILKNCIEAANSAPAEWYADLGLAQLQTGEVNEAGISCLASLARDPRCAKAHFGLGQLLITDRDFNTAISRCERALELQPDFYPAAAMIGLIKLMEKKTTNTGRKFVQRQQFEAACNCFQSILEEDPDVVEAHFGMGETYRLQGDILQAAHCYRRAIRLNGSYTPAHVQLGKALTTLGEWTAGAAELQLSLGLNPNNSEVLSLLERVRTQLRLKR
ncbi:MAG: tetratricopeptide repeat protein [Synechococcaceae cyanobacterium SM2_3_1]|nr:tetratricopeptide repeat protein [Synechococcaceae cyanobacterium SM2_3_1]